MAMTGRSQQISLRSFCLLYSNLLSLCLYPCNSCESCLLSYHFILLFTAFILNYCLFADCRQQIFAYTLPLSLWLATVHRLSSSHPV